jgi:peptidase M28-like protein
MHEQRKHVQNDDSRWFILHVVLFLLVGLLALLRYAPVPPEGRDAAPNEFSAGRAHASLERLIRPGVSHCVGSVDHARMRDAVVEEFRALDLEPEIQVTFAGNHRHRGATLQKFAQVRNIVVHLEGTEGKDAILLVAHYDSVPAGPGASDDGSGVCAILEIARILKAGPAPRNDVVFLISDAEELGMMGASGFAEEHPLMKKIRVVLNWEARGSRGPSFMFETGPSNLGLIRLMARHCRRSISTSLFPAIYDRLPNDSDLSVFKQRGIAGMNFAFIGGLPHYHTPLDTVDNLDLGSLQHQGEHFLSLARVLSHSQLDQLPQADAVYFDVLGWVTLYWSRQWNLAIACVVAAVALLVAIVSIYRSRESIAQGILALGAWPVVVVVAAIMGEAAWWLVTTCSGNLMPWPAWPQPICAALWCIGIGVPLAAWRWVDRWVSGDVSSAVMMVWWATAGLALARYMPGASYLFTVPVAAACGFRLVGLCIGPRWELANLSFLVVACLLWMPLARGLIDALGFAPASGQAVILALIGLLIAPTAGATPGLFKYLLAISGLGVAALVIASVVPTFSELWPQPVSIVYREDVDSGEAYLWVQARHGRVPASMRPDARPAKPPIVSRLSHRRSWETVRWDCAAAGFDAPTVRVQATSPVGEGRRLELLLEPAGYQRVVVVLKPQGQLTDVTANGRRIEDPSRPLEFNVSPEMGIAIELTTVGELELTVIGVRYDLPPSAKSLKDARPTWAVPWGDGDHTVVIGRLDL